MADTDVADHGGSDTLDARLVVLAQDVLELFHEVSTRAREMLAVDPMILRRCTVEHPFGTIEAWMGATHFQMRRLKNVQTGMVLHMLACNIKRMISLVGVRGLLAAIPI